MHIGMIGVGLMGHGIAANIIKNRDYCLTFLRHPGNQPTDDIEASGAIGVNSIADVTKQADVILLCVTGAPQVEEILFGGAGVAASARKGQTVLDCSTSLPQKTQIFAQKLAASGIDFCDAAMTRTPKEAEEGRLNLIVGAESKVFDRLSPLLGQFAEVVTHAGGIGSGQALKLIHNYVSLGYAGIMAEASAAALRAGIDPQIFIDVLHAGGGRSVVLDRFSPYLKDKDISRLQFSMSNAAKDIGYFIQANDDSALSSALVDLFCRGVETKGPDKSVLTMVDVLYDNDKT